MVCTNQTFQLPSKCGFPNPRQDFDNVSDPAFDIDDVYIEPADPDLYATKTLCLGETWTISMINQVCNHPNIVAKIPRLHYNPLYDDQALVPVEVSYIFAISLGNEP